MPTIRRLIALLLLAGTLPALLVTGCGSSKDDGQASALLKDTFGPGHPIRSGRLDLQANISGSGAGLTDPYILGLTGPFSTGSGTTLPRFALQLDLGPTEAANAGLISTGAKGFITINGQAFALTSEGYKQLAASYLANRKRPKGTRTTTLTALGITPQHWLSGAKMIGHANVAGADTVHVRSSVNVAALLDDANRLLQKSASLPQVSQSKKVPHGITVAERAALTRSVKTAQIDVYSGAKDHTLRRLRLHVVLEVAAGDRATLNGLRNLDVTLDLSIGQLGVPQKISAPASPRPIGELLGALAKAGGGAAAATTTTTTPQQPTSTTATTGTTTTEDPYNACLTAAGEDVAKLQQCASLVGAK